MRNLLEKTNMINTKIIFPPQNVEDELSKLGIPKEHLLEAVKRGYAARSNATENDPPSAAGTNAYNEIVRAVRELFIPNGWEKLNKQNLCFTVNAETEIAIVVSSGDEKVGIENGRDPKTKNDKGNETKRYISNNQDIFGYEEKNQKNVFPDFQTWVLLYYYDLKKSEMRLELSSPIDMDAKGYVSKWHKRIIFEAIPFDPMITVTPFDSNPTPPSKQFDGTQDFDIPVKRRKQ